MSKYVNFFLLSAIFACMPLVSFAGTNLAPNDSVGISFWIISVAMVAATAFFFLESLRVKGKFRTSLVVGGLICLVAGVHYFYMSCLLYTSPSPRDLSTSRMPSSA